MAEEVIRHRGGGRDENGEFLPDTPTTLTAIAVAPGGGTERPERARAGEEITATVYFTPGTDVVNTDELTVRGQRFRVVVNDWRSPWTSRGGLEVLCIRGQG